MSEGMVLRRRHRILRRAEFDRVFREGRKGFARGLVVFAAPSPTGESRLGMAVSRRFGKAVSRNRARRLVREAFRHSRCSWQEPLDLVVLPQGGQFPDRMQLVLRALETGVQRALASRPRRREGRKP